MDERKPPGQHLTSKFPVLHVGAIPDVRLESWAFALGGAVERSLSFDWQQFNALPQTERTEDFHCVTTWSRLDNRWSGVALETLFAMAGVQPQARFALISCYGDYTTSLPIEELLRPEVMIATRHDGAPLEPQHGGPARLVVPRLYAWKSAKWLQRIDLLEDEVLGYWEERGYHRVGDPWSEERFG